LPAAGEEFVAAVRDAANGVLEADSLESAAEAASNMGLACGNCHVASGVTVEFDEVSQPSDKEKEKPHMQRHQWAADRMWEGLIGPSKMAWSRGANLLFESPIKPDVVARHGGGEEAVGMSRRIHQLAANATAVTAPEEQAEIYAEFIANCGACHNELRK
jgi:cytochrome c553